MAFGYYSPVTVQTGQVPSTQTDFPMLVSYTDARLKTVGNGGHVQNSNGYDIRPYSDSGLSSALTFELAFYDGTTGQVEMWVKVPSLLDGYVIYLAYGDSGISTDGSSTSTWNSNFQAVYHLGNGTTLSGNDSTSNGNNGTLNNTPTAAAGKINGAAQFNGSTQYINKTSATGLGITANLSISAWIYRAGSGGGGGFAYPVSKGNAGTGFDYGLGGNSDATAIRWIANGVYDINTSISDTTWTHFVGTYNQTTAILYKNGSSAATASASAAIPNTGSELDIGMLISQARYWNGRIDELRILNVALSANWVTTEYNNHSAPSTFATLGSEVTVGGSSSGTLSAAGTGTATIIGAASSSGVLSSTGLGSSSIAGAAKGIGVLSGTGLGTALFTGNSTGNSGALSAAGTGVASFIGATKVNGTLSSAGTGLANILGNTLISGILSASGSGVANFISDAIIIVSVNPFSKAKECVRLHLNDSGIVSWSVADIDDSIQDTYDDVVVNTQCLIKKTTLAWTSNLSYYNFASLINGYLACVAIYNNVNKRWLDDDLTIRNFDQLNLDWEIKNGTPTNWAALSQDKVAIYPKYSNAAGSFDIYYWAAAPIVNNDVDPLIPLDVQSIICHGSTADLLEQFEEFAKARVFWKMYYGTREVYKDRVKNLSKTDLLFKI